jgi:hypothetical protein
MTTPDLDALIERLTTVYGPGTLAHQAAAALVHLREEVALLRTENDISKMHEHPDWSLLNQERERVAALEAERKEQHAEWERATQLDEKRIKALEAELASCRGAKVPREPTQMMIDAATDRKRPPSSGSNESFYGSIWRAMYDAAPAPAPDAGGARPRDELDGLVERLRDPSGVYGYQSQLACEASDEIERLREENARLKDCFSAREVRALVDRIAALEGKRDALAKDAERYRWLRDVGDESWVAMSRRRYPDHIPPSIEADRIDAAIDAAKEGK